MASGDLTASTPRLVAMDPTGAAIVAAINALNLAATTDRLVILPYSDSPKIVMIFKVERAA